MRASARGSNRNADGVPAQATQKPLASFMSGVFAPPNLRSRGAEGPRMLALPGSFHNVVDRILISTVKTAHLLP